MGVLTNEGSPTGETLLRHAALQCPVCRKYEFLDGSHLTHTQSAVERILRRFHEWTVSGCCVFCQSEYLESIQFKEC